MISFFTVDIHYSLRSRGDLRLWLSEVAKKEGYSIDELNIIFCSDNYLFKMNVTYLKHHTLTDIITFDNAEMKGRLSGELYISLERVRENARQLKISLKDELHRVMVHGLLHLCGYDDKSAKTKSRMTKAENLYLSKRRF